MTRRLLSMRALDGWREGEGGVEGGVLSVCRWRDGEEARTWRVCGTTTVGASWSDHCAHRNSNTHDSNEAFPVATPTSLTTCFQGQFTDVLFPSAGHPASLLPQTLLLIPTCPHAEAFPHVTLPRYWRLKWTHARRNQS